MKHFSQKSWGGVSKLFALLAAFLLVLSPTIGWAQNTVKGTVVDEAGEPVIGATVVVVGTQMGTTTDINGHFALQNIKKESVLQISFIGYETVNFPVNGVSNLTVELKSDSEKIDEVVVVGYGVQKKASVTAAISQIAGTELELSLIHI